MNFMKYHVSRNLTNIPDYSERLYDFYYTSDKLLLSNAPAGTYTLSAVIETDGTNAYMTVGTGTTEYAADLAQSLNLPGGLKTMSFTISGANVGKNVYARFVRYDSPKSVLAKISNVMLNTGSTALPYDPPGNTWLDSHYIMGTDTDAITTLPSTIYPTNTYLNVELEGNSVQNGTPSPSSPVDVNGVGDESDVTGFIVTTTINDITTTEVIARGDAYSKTAPTISGKTFNYWTDGTQIVSYNSSLGCIITENIHYTAIYSDSTVTKEDVMLLSMEKSTYNNMDAVACVLNTHILSGTDVTEIGIKFATNRQLGYDSSYGSDYATVNLMELPDWDVYSLLQTLGSERPSDFTNINTRYSFSVGVSTAHQAYLYFIGYYKYNDNGTIKTVYSNYAVGGCYDTALTPSVPTTHYNIPITCSNITYNRYLSETESIRYIKKLVLTGDENWYVEGSDVFYTDPITETMRYTPICSHFIGANTLTGNNQVTISQSLRINIKTTTITHTANDFKTYLAQQYAAGTPVTVWYVLSTPETSTINEPLMKVGNYTDKINTTIPTKGTTEITVNTTIQPSNISVDGFQNMEIGLKGNTVQSGTPTPENPIMPQGTGDKTANLFSSVWEQGSINAIDGQNVVAGTIVRTKDYIPIKPNTAYSFSRDISNGHMNVRLYRADKSYIGSGSDSTIRLITGSTVPNPMGTNVSFCCFEVIDGEAAYIRLNDASNNTATKWLMVEGEYTRETMPEYEPYGYKIPILSANTTTPVYLGEVESTRRIRELVLTGQETGWQQAGASGGRSRFVINVSDAINADTSNPYSICSHLPLGASGATYSSDNVYTFASGKLYMRLTVDYDTLVAFKAYLAQQYANGTPVTLWYVLATPTTGIVNEPLRKIGEYADEVSGITIPTIAGANTLSVDTTLQPSEVTATYKGWHPVTDVHERDNGAWTE